MNTIRFRNTTKYMLPTLILLMMLLSMFAGISIKPAKSLPPIEFTIYATETTNPDWGYYGGYHNVWDKIALDLREIGIELIRETFDPWTWYDRISGSGGWNLSHADGGWDMYIQEWWLQPHAIDPWFTSMVRSDMVSDLDPGGYNSHPWRNAQADILLNAGMQSFSASARQTNLWAWQEEFMKDPPQICLYYPYIYDILATWLTGYDSTGSWFYDLGSLHLNSTMLAAAKPLRDPNTLIYAISEYMQCMSPAFLDSYTDENIATVAYRTPYKWSCDPFPEWPNVPDLDDYVIVPDMAADYPTYLDGGKRVRVPIREGMVWHYKNGTTYPINATDFKWTFDTMMHPDSGFTGTADFWFVIENCTIVDEYTVDYECYFPYPEILSVLANDWGTACPLPWHLLKDIPPGDLDGHVTNKDYVNQSNWMPVSGPFIWDSIEPDVQCTMKRNPDYYGYNASIVNPGGTPLGPEGETHWGPYNVDTLIFKWEASPAARLASYINGDIDFGEYPTAPVETFKDLNNTVAYPNLRVFQYLYPAGNPINFNFDNEYLSNRYVRLAIAHAIDYDHIINNLLDEWGIEYALRGKTYILPQHWYDDDGPGPNPALQLFNTALPPYSYDPVLAQQFMDLWKYSQTGEDYTLSPIGDGDFNRIADLNDFYLWRDEGFGLTMPIPFLPGQDKDPDFDNTGYIEMADFFRWRDYWGATYP
ncbi:MAG: ABC transporter substrate-binding protein [Candidatus Bathyarchaeota archaeon]|jgi:ABC-type transport system substrate-binding protein